MKMKSLLLTLVGLHMTAAAMNVKAFNASDDLKVSPVTLNAIQQGEESSAKGGTYLVDLIKAKGCNFLTGSLPSTEGQSVVDTILAQLGIGHFTDAIVEFEKIEESCQQTQKQIKKLDEKTQKSDDEKYMNDILNQVSAFKSNKADAIDEIGALIHGENNGTGEKEHGYNDLIKNIKSDVDGANIQAVVQKLCESISRPNASKDNVSIFDLYKNTLGTYQKWNYETLKPTREFITYISSILLKGILIANYDAAYGIKGLNENDSARIDYQSRISDMSKAFNEVMGVFKNKLDELDALEKDINTSHFIEYDYKGKNIKMFSYLAHINMYEKENNAMLLFNGKKGKDKTYNSLANLHANEDFYKLMFEDYSEIKDLYESEGNEFGFKDYVTTCGFNLGTLNDNVKGFYRQTFFEDPSIPTHWTKVDYYDLNVPNKNHRVTAFKSYVDGGRLTEAFLGKYDHIDQTPREAFNNEYLCFVDANYKLDGFYGDIVPNTCTGVDGIGSDIVTGIPNGGNYDPETALKLKDSYLK